MKLSIIKSTNTVILVGLFLLSAFLHQPLYFLLPLIACAYIYTNKGLIVPNRRFERLFFSMLLTVFAFFIIQTILELEIKIFAIKGVLRYVAYATFGLMILQFDNNDLKGFFKAVCWFFVLSLP